MTTQNDINKMTTIINIQSMQKVCNHDNSCSDYANLYSFDYDELFEIQAEWVKKYNKTINKG